MNLTLNKISKSFVQGENRLSILSNLDLSVKTGETVAVVGESGSGKSTLLALLAGFDRPDSGAIRWDEADVEAWDDREWARFRRAQLGFVFQSYRLIPYLTAQENVALPLRLLAIPSADQRARESLSALGLSPRLGHLPHQLSGGECQRVAIARALVHGPRLLLADEPTGSLDARTGEQVLDQLFTQMTGRHQTGLIVTHSQEVARRCHRILTLREGRLWSS